MNNTAYSGIDIHMLSICCKNTNIANSLSINRLIGSVGDNKIVDHIQFIPSSNISVLNFVFTLNWIKYIQIGKYILGDTNKILHLLLND